MTESPVPEEEVNTGIIAEFNLSDFCADRNNLLHLQR